MKKSTYVTIVSENYQPFLFKLIESHQLFSRIDLVVFTVNFEISNLEYPNVSFVKYNDENLQEYLDLGDNKFIKNDYQKHKYTTLLKPKILKNFLHLCDYFFFVDCDSLFTKNSDILFLNSINEFQRTEIPISVKYYHQYSNHGTGENVFREDGSFNEKSLTYLPIVEFFGEKLNVINYVTTYCLYYTSECFNFFKEVEDICFDENIIRDYDKFLPLGDETVFNYMYSKLDFKKFISGFLCYDVPPHFDIDRVSSNLKKLNEIISFIHTKRFINDFSFETPYLVKEDEYKNIFDILRGSFVNFSEGEIVSMDQNLSANSDTIFFNFGKNSLGYSEINLVSLFRPGKNFFYNIDAVSGVNYYLVKENDKIVKDLYLVASIDRNIKEVLKIN